MLLINSVMSKFKLFQLFMRFLFLNFLLIQLALVINYFHFCNFHPMKKITRIKTESIFILRVNLLENQIQSA